ncbi:MAG: RNA degradosome polyphosphate kinase, partial [Pseudomonadota bacterium]
MAEPVREAPGRAGGGGEPLRERPDRFINRELSWLRFNERVLEEADNPNHPLLERLRFLSISANNLDEFLMVRVAGLVAQQREGVDARSDDGLTAGEQLVKINEAVVRLHEQQQRQLVELRERLAEVGIEFVESHPISDAEAHTLEEAFMSEVFPVLTPLAIDPAHPFPFIPNLGYSLALKLKPPEGPARIALVRIPAQLKRFIRLSGDDNNARFIALGYAIRRHLDKLFPDHEVLATGSFRVIRDSDLEIEEEAEDLVRTFESALKRRRRGSVVRLEIEASTPDELKTFVAKALGVEGSGMIVIDGLLALKDLSQLVSLERPELKFVPFTARFPERVLQQGGNCFAAIRAKDMVIHHPYESFDVVAQFVAQAAADPD